MSDPDDTGGGNVIDFQTEAIGRLRARVTALDSAQAALLAVTRQHQGADRRLFEAVLAALDAQGLDHLVHVITADWVDMLGVDAVALALETGGQRINLSPTGVQFLAADGLDELASPDLPVVSGAVDEGAALFGPAASLVRAQACIRFGGESPDPSGVLALGVRDADGLSHRFGSEALLFLGQIVNRCLLRWLTTTP